MKVRLNNVRVNWSRRIFEAQDYQGNCKFKYSCEFIMDEDSEVLKLVNKTIDEAGKAEFKDAWVREKKKLVGGKNYCLKDGDDNYNKDNEVRNGYAGTYYFKASNDKQPFAVDRAKRKVTEDDGVIYDGCFVNAIIDIWPQNNKYGKGMNAKLLGVQFFNDGDPLSVGATASVDEFEEYEQTEEMGEDLDDGEELL